MSIPGNFNEAVRLHGDWRLLALERALRCPRCDARNTAGGTVIELEAPTLARCSCCTKTFNPIEEQEP